jgi:hypothetical protein
MHKPTATIIITTITTVVALSALAAGMATAAKPEFLPANGKFPVKFTSHSGPGSLKNGALAIECKSETDKGEITGTKTVTDTIDFEKCDALGLAMHSLGDSGETILTTVTGELCYINEAKKEVGLLLTPTAKVHIEVPAAGELILLLGSVTGALTPINVSTLEFRLLFKEVGGAQNLGCGEKVEALDSGVNEGEETSAILVNHTIIGLLEQTITLDA